MKNLMMLVVVFSAVFCQTAFSRVVMLDKDRTVSVVGPIKDLRKQANRLLEFSEANNKPVYVVINSLGGDIVGGLPLITAIDRVKSRGIKVSCVVDGMAMSMATYILAACSTRYALPTGLIMWHPVASSLVVTRLTEKTSQQIKTQLTLLSEYLDNRLRRSLGINKTKFEEYNEGQYIVFANDLNKKIAPRFLKIVKDIRTKK